MHCFVAAQRLPRPQQRAADCQQRSNDCWYAFVFAFAFALLVLVSGGSFESKCAVPPPADFNIKNVAGCGAMSIARTDNIYQVWGLLVVAGLGIGGIVVPASIITTIICPDVSVCLSMVLVDAATREATAG